MQFVGSTYYYGGDDPMGGFDCSGYVQEILKAGGVIKRTSPKMNAQMICDYLRRRGAREHAYRAGSISFYGSFDGHTYKVGHIGFCISGSKMLHAGGGNSDTIDEETAIRRNAFVRMDDIRYRKDFLYVALPDYGAAF